MRQPQGEWSAVLPLLLWELQQPLVLLDRSRRCCGISHGFLDTCEGEGESSSETQGDLQVLLSQLWPLSADIPLRAGEFKSQLLKGSDPLSVEGRCIPLSSELFLFSFTPPDEAEAVFHQQRMQTLGFLAGGVAHDFNNILAGILGHITFLRAVLPEDGPHAESLEAITTGAKKASALTKQILDFSKFDLAEEDPQVQLSALVESIAPLMKGALTSRVPLNLELPEEEFFIHGSEGKIAQILVNLVVNARDAVEQEGEVSVVVRRAREEEQREFSAREEETECSFVVLEVVDNGTGMSEQVRSRAFEPYFSTKGEHGTGLGLATVSSIVESFGGKVRIQSTLGVGTTMQIFLRETIEDDEKLGDSEASGGAALPSGSESILVVDDEEAVRNVVSMSLRHLGYEVTERSDSREAVDLVRNGELHYDLVVLDMLMPHMTGEEVFQAIRETRPELAVLIMSGYSDEGAIDRILAEQRTSFIHKPFTVEELSNQVRDALDGKFSNEESE
ncbi:response regulator [bacterium]|nr:response regulator [bacterium]